MILFNSGQNRSKMDYTSNLENQTKRFKTVEMHRAPDWTFLFQKAKAKEMIVNVYERIKSCSFC